MFVWKFPELEHNKWERHACLHILLYFLVLTKILQLVLELSWRSRGSYDTTGIHQLAFSSTIVIFHMTDGLLPVPVLIYMCMKPLVFSYCRSSYMFLLVYLLSALLSSSRLQSAVNGLHWLVVCAGIFPVYTWIQESAGWLDGCHVPSKHRSTYRLIYYWVFSSVLCFDTMPFFSICSTYRYILTFEELRQLPSYIVWSKLISDMSGLCDPTLICFVMNARKMTITFWVFARWVFHQ